jgi:hypothetical protein
MSFIKFRAGIGSEGEFGNSWYVPLRLEVPRRERGGRRGNEIGCHARHADRNLKHIRREV